MKSNKRMGRSIKKTAFTINVIGFGLIGFVYYFIYFLMVKKNNLEAYHPLYSGILGIWVSILGSLCSYYYIRYNRIYFHRLVIYSIVFSYCYFFAFFFFDLFFDSTYKDSFAIIWAGLLFVLYFLFLGGLNGFFGKYIALFNIIIIAFFFSPESDSISPALWVDVLSLVGVNNPLAQWFIVLFSVILGLSNKGIEMFDL